MDVWSWSVKCSMSIRLKDSGFIYYMIGKKQQKKKGKSGKKYEEEQSDFLECCLCAMQTHLLRFRMGKNNSHQNG